MHDAFEEVPSLYVTSISLLDFFDTYVIDLSCFLEQMIVTLAYKC